MQESGKNHKNKNDNAFFPLILSFEIHNSPMRAREKESIVGCPLRIGAYHVLGFNCEILSEPRFCNFLFFFPFSNFDFSLDTSKNVSFVYLFQLSIVLNKI